MRVPRSIRDTLLQSIEGIQSPIVARNHGWRRRSGKSLPRGSLEVQSPAREGKRCRREENANVVDPCGEIWRAMLASCTQLFGVGTAMSMIGAVGVGLTFRWLYGEGSSSFRRQLPPRCQSRTKMWRAISCPIERTANLGEEWPG